MIRQVYLLLPCVSFFFLVFVSDAFSAGPIILSSRAIRQSKLSECKQKFSSTLSPKRREHERPATCRFSSAGDDDNSLFSSNYDQNAASSEARKTQSRPQPSDSTNFDTKKNNYNNNRKQQGNFSQRKTPKKNKVDSHKILNYRLVQSTSATELFQVLQSTTGALTQKAGGGALNMINFSTALHRLARHSLQPHARAPLLTDPRFALLIAALAEAMMDSNSDTQREFSTRELSNIGWALAKLKIAPPATVIPLLTDPQHLSLALDSMSQDIRKVVLEAAQARQSGGETERNLQNVGAAPSWVPLVSKISGVLIDHVRLQVSQLITQGRASFPQQEISNLLWAWATCGRAEPQLFGNMVKLLIRKQQESSVTEKRPQEWSNSLWAAATAQIYIHHEDLLEFLADSFLQDHNSTFLYSFKAQELSNTLWGVATLLSNKQGDITAREQQSALIIERYICSAVINRANEFKTQELSNTIWSLATLGFGLAPSPDSAANQYVVLQSDCLASDQNLMQQTVTSLISAALLIVHKMRSQELNNIAWALARLVTRNGETLATATSNPFVNQIRGDLEALLLAIGQQLGDRQRKVSLQDIGTTLWSMATLGFFRPDLYRGMANRLVRRDAERGKPQELSNMLWAFATAEIEVQDEEEKDAYDTTLLLERPPVRDPVVACFGIAAREMMQRPYEFKTQEMKDILWSFSKVNIRHPALFRFIAEHLVGADESQQASARGLAEFSPQGVGNLAWAFARQAQLSEDVAARRKGTILTSGVNGRLAVYTTGYFDIGENLLQRLFVAIAETGIHVHGKLSDLKPQDLSNTAWTFGVFGLRHEAFVEAAVEQLVLRTSAFLRGESNLMTTFKGQELGNLLWSLATLNVKVEQDILEQLSRYLQKFFDVNLKNERDDQKSNARIISKYFKRQELANIAWSCAVFGTHPQSLMSMLYDGLLGSSTDRDPNRMADIYDDGGLQLQEIMAIIYVHLALSLELGSRSNGFSLPRDFPVKWQYGYTESTTSSGYRKKDNTRDLGLDLSLTTSKIQQAVSSAFHRIGFDHCEEHIITMEDLANNYGLDIPPRPLQVLSIDIANLEKRIAIEVDGPPHYICRIDKGVEKTGYPKMLRGKWEYQFGWKGHNQAMNGPTALKHRILTDLGWNVISLPFWDWYALEGDFAKEDKYCMSLLEEYGHSLL